MIFDKDNITKQEEEWNEILFSNIHHRLSDIIPKAGNPKTKSVSARDIEIKSGEMPHTHTRKVINPLTLFTNVIITNLV